MLCFYAGEKLILCKLRIAFENLQGLTVTVCSVRQVGIIFTDGGIRDYKVARRK